MAQAPFTIQSHLTAITLAYRNAGFIADMVLPRLPVASPSFKYSSYALADAFTIPDTKVGRKSAPNEIDWSGSEQSASTSDYALDDLIPMADIEAADAAPRVAGVKPIDPEARSTELLSDLIALDREKRVADLVFAAGSYPSANKATLSGTAQWSDYANSDPISVILAAMDSMVIRPNKMVFGQAAWTKFRQHPKVTAALFPLGGNASAGGAMATRQAVAELLEIEEVMVGQAWYNSAKPGQTASMARLWGKHVAMMYQAPVVTSPQGVITFGLTAQWGSRIAGTVENDPSVGMRGGNRVRVGEAVKELILASDTGYLWTNAVA